MADDPRITEPHPDAPHRRTHVARWVLAGLLLMFAVVEFGFAQQVQERTCFQYAVPSQPGDGASLTQLPRFEQHCLLSENAETPQRVLGYIAIAAFVLLFLGALWKIGAFLALALGVPPLLPTVQLLATLREWPNELALSTIFSQQAPLLLLGVALIIVALAALRFLVKTILLVLGIVLLVLGLSVVVRTYLPMLGA